MEDHGHPSSLWASGLAQQRARAWCDRYGSPATRRTVIPVELGLADFSDSLLKAAPGFTFVIWIAKRVVAGLPIDLTKILAHEHRHLEHFLHDRNPYYAGSVAYEYLLWLAENGVPGNDFDAPTEWDAEARARLSYW